MIVFAGDGAMQMNGLAELITIKHYWQQWADPRLIIAVLHNNDLNQVTWEMRAMEGAPKFTESQTLPDVDYAAFAASLGLQAITVDKPDQIGPAWDRALAADRPTVLDVHTDPNVPPIPPHATFEQMKDAAERAAQGRRRPVGRHQGRRQDQGPGVPAPLVGLTEADRVVSLRAPGWPGHGGSCSVAGYLADAGTSGRGRARWAPDHPGSWVGSMKTCGASGSLVGEPPVDVIGGFLRLCLRPARH